MNYTLFSGKSYDGPTDGDTYEVYASLDELLASPTLKPFDLDVVREAIEGHVEDYEEYGEEEDEPITIYDSEAQSWGCALYYGERLEHGERYADVDPSIAYIGMYLEA